MKKEEMLKFIKDIGTCQDEAQRRTLLSDFETGLSQDYDTLQQTTEQNEQYRLDMENLRQANMKLFLRVGEQNKEPDKPEATNTFKDLKYEDLFNEQGGLK